MSQTPTPTPETPPNVRPATESGPPVEYTPFTAPEGQTLDPKAVEGATAIFREFGLNQSQAQRLIDFQLGRDTELSTKSAETYNQMRKGWRDQVEVHPVLGGTRLDETRAEIGKAIATLPPELGTAFKEAMNLTGAGDHPAVVEVFHILSKVMNEGKHVSGVGPSELGQAKPGTAVRPSQAASMFPNLPSSTH